MQRASKLITYAVIAVFVILFSLFAGGGTQFASAAASTYSNVMTDLTKDESFNASDYPENVKNYSLNVIQIAESENGELFVYVYQPSGQKVDLKASTISIAEQPNNADDFAPALYELELLNSNNTLYKYKVVDFKVSTKAKERFYNLIMIQRPFISGVDSSSSGNTMNRKAYALGQYWYATTNDNGVNYRMVLVDYVEIINPFTGYIRNDKVATSSTSTEYFQDNYYVAFSTNRNIEQLLSATVSYRRRDYYYSNNSVLGFDSTNFNSKANFSNEKNNITKEVLAEEVTNLQQDGFSILWGAINNNKQFTWQRIQSATDFVNNAGASSSDNEQVSKLQWVLMFDEVSVYRYESYGTFITVVEEAGQLIDLVTVLRLEFVENGITYNLGAVSDTVSKDFNFNDNDDVDNKPQSGCAGTGCNGTWAGLPWWGWLLIFTLGPAAIVLVYVTVYLIIKAVSGRRSEAAATSTTKRKKRKPRKGGKK